jgi:biopolymer transport protein ExbD
MPWRLRHEGSPQIVANQVSATQIVEGLRDSVYDSTDEIRGPGEKLWQRLEVHPQFSEIVEHLEEEADLATHEPEDNHIDMNPLIDVCLVLLVFFILATTLSIMQHAIELPPNQQNKETPPRQIDPKDLEKYIMLTIEKKNGATTFDVNGVSASRETLTRELERLVNDRKTDLILDIKPGVDFDAYVFAYDCATTARVKKVLTKSLQKAGRAAPGKTPDKTPGK